MPDNIAIFSIVILLLPMLYLLLASPAFLLVPLDIPQVAFLLRTMFRGYFAVLLTIGVLTAIGNAAEGRMRPALFICGVTAFVILWRRWLKRRLNSGLEDVEAGIAGTAPRLRHLHWIGMATNALQTGATFLLIPSLVLVA